MSASKKLAVEDYFTFAVIPSLFCPTSSIKIFLKSGYICRYFYFSKQLIANNSNSLLSKNLSPWVY